MWTCSGVEVIPLFSIFRPVSLPLSDESSSSLPSEHDIPLSFRGFCGKDGGRLELGCALTNEI